MHNLSDHPCWLESAGGSGFVGGSESLEQAWTWSGWGNVCSLRVYKRKVNVGQLATVAGCVYVSVLSFRACICPAPTPLLCHFCFSPKHHPPLDLDRGHVTFPTRLCLCVCAYKKEREKEREVPASLTKESLMHSCWKMKLQVKVIIFFSHLCDRFYCWASWECECVVWEHKCTESSVLAECCRCRCYGEACWKMMCLCFFSFSFWALIKNYCSFPCLSVCVCAAWLHLHLSRQLLLSHFLLLFTWLILCYAGVCDVNILDSIAIFLYLVSLV